jgi:signal transduction histidine kinase/ActR/RegA family two-component response regulator
MHSANHSIAVCHSLALAISGTRTVDEIYQIALDALTRGMGVSRASILLVDAAGTMRFTAWRGLSDGYRAAVEGHTPWSADAVDPQPIVVPDVTREPSLAAFLPTIGAEGIAGMAFIPLVSLGRVIGKFMVYLDEPRSLSDDDLQLASVIAAHVAFAVERTRAEAHARRSEAHMRYVLDAAALGTWDWDLTRQTVQWSENVERLHGVPPGTFDRTFASYERCIHPEDRAGVMDAIRQVLADGTTLDVEYRMVAPDGTERWVEAKGLVERTDGRAVRLSGVCGIATPRKEAEHARLASAEEASRLKDDFLATLSHELRTPLNAILGWVQMLLAGTLPADRARQAIEIIGRNAKAQAQLIEDILDISRIITGKLEIEPQIVSVPHLMDGVVGAALPAARAKQITISKHVPDGMPPIDGDPKRLHQVLSSVIGNAIQFTPEKGTVDIRAVTDGDGIEITVRDSGTGIPAEFLPHVFDRFRQADSRATRRHGGLGLGLAIARHVLEQHRGHIRADSDGPGLGTTITMRLPARAMPQGQTVVPVAATHGGLALRLDGAKVVVVDDQRDSCELLAALFEQCGAHVVQCANAPAALSTLLSSSVQLLVADIAMPDVDGYDLIRQVRQIDARLPAVAVTAYAYPQDRLKALAAGFTAYCSKPIDATHFLRIVRNVMLSSELSSPTPPATPAALDRMPGADARRQPNRAG